MLFAKLFWSCCCLLTTQDVSVKKHAAVATPVGKRLGGGDVRVRSQLGMLAFAVLLPSLPFHFCLFHRSSSGQKKRFVQIQAGAKGDRTWFPVPPLCVRARKVNVEKRGRMCACALDASSQSDAESLDSQHFLKTLVKMICFSDSLARKEGRLAKIWEDDLDIYLRPDRSNRGSNDFTSDMTWLTAAEDSTNWDAIKSDFRSSRLKQPARCLSPRLRQPN